jgi:hypothetical protein
MRRVNGRQPRTEHPASIATSVSREARTRPAARPGERASVSVSRQRRDEARGQMAEAMPASATSEFPSL